MLQLPRNPQFLPLLPKRIPIPTPPLLCVSFAPQRQTRMKEGIPTTGSVRHHFDIFLSNSVQHSVQCREKSAPERFYLFYLVFVFLSRMVSFSTTFSSQWTTLYSVIPSRVGIKSNSKNRRKNGGSLAKLSSWLKFHHTSWRYLPDFPNSNSLIFSTDNKWSNLSWFLRREGLLTNTLDFPPLFFKIWLSKILLCGLDFGQIYSAQGRDRLKLIQNLMITSFNLLNYTGKSSRKLFCHVIHTWRWNT